MRKTTFSAAQPIQQGEGSGRNTTTIVVGVDGSETSWSALWWACGEATRLAGRVVAVYVSWLTNPGLAAAAIAGVDAGAYMQAREQTDHEHTQRLKADVQAAARQLGVRIDFLHLRGEPAEQLLRAARDRHADVLAVGRSANIRHRLAGSLGRKLTRERDIPIIVIVP